MKNLKVLWLDDEHQRFEPLIDYVSQKGIELIGFDNAIEGISELKKKYWYYDAVILDGKFFVDKESKGNALDDEAFGKVAYELKRLKDSRVILPWFIYSGQASFVKERNTMVSVLADTDFAEGRIFDKNKDEDLDSLCDEIKKAASDIEYVRIKNDHQDVFELCDDKYMGEEITLPLLSAIKIAEQKGLTESNEAFNGLRKIIELLFGKLNKIGLLPDEIININGWVNRSSLFLAGKHNDYSLDSEIVHPTVSFMLHGVLQIVQDASHSYADNLNLKVDNFLSLSSTPYLYRSTLNQVLDILVWFKKHMDTFPTSEHNNRFWTKKESESNSSDMIWVPGEIVRIATNDWGTFQPSNGASIISIPPRMVKNYDLKEGQQVEIISEPSPDGTKKHIKEIKI